MPDADTDATSDWNTSRQAPDKLAVDEDNTRNNVLVIGTPSYKLLGSDDSVDESTKKTHRLQLIDKLQLDDDHEHSFLVENINETIACNRELQSLFARIERDPHLYITTFLNANINTLLDIKAEISNSLVFSVLNLIRNEAVMRRALEPDLTAELNGVRTPADLLRKNSQTTRLLTLCAKALGQNIIAGAVHPVIRNVLEHNLMFEIDPAIEANEEIRKNNLNALCDTAAELLKRVLADVPSALASVCRITYAAIEAKFPNQGWIGISNILFLRFVSSSILVPAAGSCFSTQQKRNLVLLTKLVQSAASLRKFDAKETFMQSTNQFLSMVIPQLSEFYKQFAVEQQVEDDSLPVSMRSYLVVRKISSLTRIDEYLDILSNNPAALSQTSDALVARIAYHHGFRRIIFSALHDCVFLYEDRKQQGEKPALPLERYPIEKIEMPVLTVNGVLVLKVPDTVRLQFTNDEECIKWRNRIESNIQKYKSQV